MATKPHELTQEEWDNWNYCAFKGCDNKCCLSLNSKYCWPHTTGTPEQAKENLLLTENFDISNEQETNAQQPMKVSE